MRVISRIVALAAGLLLLSLTGCITYTSFQTPEVSPPMHFNGGGGISICGFYDVDTLGYYGGSTDSSPSYSGWA